MVTAIESLTSDSDPRAVTLEKVGRLLDSLEELDATRLAESEMVARKIIETVGIGASVTSHNDARAALDGADFVIVAFQIGGYEPCTVTDFELPNKVGLRQTIADTLGIGGIMRGLRTVPHLLRVCEDMRAVAPDEDPILVDWLRSLPDSLRQRSGD